MKSIAPLPEIRERQRPKSQAAQLLFNNLNQPCFAFIVAAKLGFVMFFNAEHILPCFELAALYHGVWTFQ